MSTGHEESLNALAIRELEKRIDQRFASMQRALDVASDETRLKGAAQNEWRAQYGDLTSTFARREYVDGRVSFLQAEIEPLKLSKAALEGKASATTALGALALSALSLVATLSLGLLTLTRGL